MIDRPMTLPGALFRRFRRLDRLVFAVLGFFALALTAMPASAQLFGGNDSEAQRRQAELSLQVNQLEGQIRTLNGQIEQLTFQMRQMQDQMQKMQKDTDFRLQDLENRGASPAIQKKPPKKTELTPATPIAPANAGLDPSQGPGDASMASTNGSIETLEPGAAPNDPYTNNPVPPASIGGGRTLGAPPQVLGQITAADDPIAGVIGDGPMDLGQGQRNDPAGSPPVVQRTLPAQRAMPGAPEPIPGVSPKYATAQPVPSARDEYDAAYGYILNGEYELAERSFKTFLVNHPTDKRAGSAQFWLGESFFQRNLHREATDAFLKSYTQYPDDVKAPDSLLKLGLAYQGLGERKAACNAYEELLTKYPKASRALRDRAQAEKSRGKCS